MADTAGDQARSLVVVSAGLSTPSSTRMLADQLASASADQLAARGIAAEVETFELRDYAHELVNMMLTGFADEKLERMINRLIVADGVIAVTPIFSTSYNALFKALFDVLEPGALAGRPVLIGANAGTARHSLAIDYAIRPLFAYLHAEAVSTGVFAASSDWSGGDEVAPLGERIAKGAREFAEAVAAKPARGRVEDPFDPASFGGSRSFGHLLGGLAGE